MLHAAFWFPHHKRVKEFRITCYVLNIQRKTRVFAAPIAKKTPPVRKGTAQKPTQRCIKAARDRGDGEETPSSVPVVPWRAEGMWNPRLCLPGGARDITRSSPGVSRKFCPEVGLLRLLHKKASNPALPQVQLFGIMPNKHPLFIQIIIKKLPLTVA